MEKASCYDVIFSDQKVHCNNCGNDVAPVFLAKKVICRCQMTTLEEDDSDRWWRTSKPVHPEEDTNMGYKRYELNDSVLGNYGVEVNVGYDVKEESLRKTTLLQPGNFVKIRKGKEYIYAKSIKYDSTNHLVTFRIIKDDVVTMQELTLNVKEMVSLSFYPLIVDKPLKEQTEFSVACQGDYL